MASKIGDIIWRIRFSAPEIIKNLYGETKKTYLNENKDFPENYNNKKRRRFFKSKMIMRILVKNKEIPKKMQ